MPSGTPTSIVASWLEVACRMDGCVFGMEQLFSGRNKSLIPHSQTSPFREQISHIGCFPLPVLMVRDPESFRRVASADLYGNTTRLAVSVRVRRRGAHVLLAGKGEMLAYTSSVYVYNSNSLSDNASFSFDGLSGIHAPPLSSAIHQPCRVTFCCQGTQRGRSLRGPLGLL